MDGERQIMYSCKVPELFREVQGFDYRDQTMILGCKYTALPRVENKQIQWWYCEMLRFEHSACAFAAAECCYFFDSRVAPERLGLRLWSKRALNINITAI